MSDIKKKYKKAEYYTNRELSWLDFNARVLEEARNRETPLLERLNFLGITQSNVDEFFMVRVASLYKLVEGGVQSLDSAGMTAGAQIRAISEREHEAVDLRYTTYNKMLLPALASEGIYIRQIEDLTVKQYDTLRRYYDDEIYPVLTPMADDSSRPFPFLKNDSLNLAVQLISDQTQEKKFATVRVPDVFPRFLALSEEANAFVLLEDIIREFLHTLFHGYMIKSTSAYRVTRDMDLDVAEQDAPDLLRAVQTQLRAREHGSVMRLEVEAGMKKELCNHLIERLGVDENAIYHINGPIDLTFLKKLPGAIDGHDDLRYQPFESYKHPDLTMNGNIFEHIRTQDYLMQHPYDSFSSVVNFIHQAAIDPDVLAIKMTLYRVSSSSPIIKYLGQAAQAGKQVTVLVEVKARFDEQNNVRWSRQLEKMGCHVIYGLVGLKTHSKIALVIRRDEDGIRRYLHLGTGNYNDVTAHFYTDMGLFTSDRDLGVDASNLFNMLSGFSRPPYFHKLHISPRHIREFIYEKVDAEIEAAKAGRPALIKMKMNSLSDPDVIAKLYEASAAGVKIQLIVRGICCLRTGIPEISDNIEVHSIVGRFLEHSRIYYFYHDGNEDVYLASADMMTRNLDRRVELLFPIEQEDLHQRTMKIFDIMWSDNVQARLLVCDRFTRINRRNQEPLSSQDRFIAQAARQIEKQKERRREAKENPGVFTPMQRHEETLETPQD